LERPQLDTRLLSHLGLREPSSRAEATQIRPKGLQDNLLRQFHAKSVPAKTLDWNELAVRNANC